MATSMTVTPSANAATLHKATKKLELPGLLGALREWDFLLRDQGKYFDFQSQFCRLKVTESSIEMSDITDRDQAVSAAMAVIEQRGWGQIEIASSDTGMLTAMASAARQAGVEVRLTQEQEQAMAGPGRAPESKMEIS